MKQLKVYASLGKEATIGWMRDDVPMVHGIGQAAPGTLFKPSNGRGGPHWPCVVCKAHGYTEKDFHEQLTAMATEQQSNRRSFAKPRKAVRN